MNVYEQYCETANGHVSNENKFYQIDSLLTTSGYINHMVLNFSTNRIFEVLDIAILSLHKQGRKEYQFKKLFKSQKMCIDLYKISKQSASCFKLSGSAISAANSRSNSVSAVSFILIRDT